MKKNKLIAIGATIAMCATMVCTSLSAYAADITNGVELKLIEQNETSVKIGMYYKGDLTTLGAAIYKVEFPAEVVSSAAITKGLSFSGSDACDVDPADASGYVSVAYTSDPAVAVKDGDLIAELVLTLENASTDFVVSTKFDGYTEFSDQDWENEYFEEDLEIMSITVPAFSTEPEVIYHKDVKAEEVANSNELLDAAAKGYEATVNYADGVVGNLVWKVTAGDQVGTVDAVTGTDVSGAPTVIYGLIIVDANVDKVTDVVLTNVVE